MRYAHSVIRKLPLVNPVITLESDEITEENGSKGDEDTVGWRCIKVSNGEVEFFNADTDGDGYRNTEYGWYMGNLVFSLDTLSGGVIK